jgi:hypothetical protein
LSNVLGVTFALAPYLPLVSFIDQTRNSQTANFTYRVTFASRTGGRRNIRGEAIMGTILIVVLVLMLVGAFPRWPHSREWGYAPTGGVGLLLVILLVLVLSGRL